MSATYIATDLPSGPRAHIWADREHLVVLVNGRATVVHHLLTNPAHMASLAASLTAAARADGQASALDIEHRDPS